MTQREITKLRVINQTIDAVINIKEAAELLSLSERQVIRLKKGVMEQGPAFIIHKNRGRKPKHALFDDIRGEIIELKKYKYREANFAHFRELLGEHEGIFLSYPTIYRILSRAGITSPKKQRKRKAHHRRKRKPQEGMMVQIDASPHKWILGKDAFSLHGAVDDATGKIVALFYTKNECLEGYFQIMEQMISRHGIPMSLYCDRHTIFVSPKDDKLTVDEQLQGKRANLTQFGRAMQELGVTIIKARSAQGKGRIERLWETLQSRLPVEFKVHGICTMEAANAFLAQFVDTYNARFAVLPECPQSAFRQFDAGVDLANILCVKEERTLTNEGVFSYRGKHFQLVGSGRKVSAPFKAKITVLETKDGVKAAFAGNVYETEELEKRPKVKPSAKAKSGAQRGLVRVVYSPASNHPWRIPAKERPKPFYEETDREILAMLGELFGSTRAWA